MELNYWTGTFSALTSRAAMLTGFTFSGLFAIAEEKGKMTTLNMAYLVATVISMGCGLLCITTSSFCLMLGPGKALRASSIKGIEETINVMKDKSIFAFWCFVGELVFFHISSFMLMWILYSPFVSLLVNAVLFAFLMQFMSEGQDIM